MRRLLAAALVVACTGVMGSAQAGDNDPTGGIAAGASQVAMRNDKWQPGFGQNRQRTVAYSLILW
jgi:hypothetical protein